MMAMVPYRSVFDETFLGRAIYFSSYSKEGVIKHTSLIVGILVEFSSQVPMKWLAKVSAEPGHDLPAKSIKGAID